jgi:N-acetylglutamate synthase-like GNAT family acetyltransferase
VIERIRALRDAADRRLCDAIEPFELGGVLRTPSLPDVYQLNALRLEHDAGAEDVAAAADRLQADLAHRKAFTRLPVPGEHLLTEFAALGWSVERVAVMAWQDGDPRPRPGAARELDASEAARLRERFYRVTTRFRGERELRQLLDRDARVMRALAGREVGAPADGDPVAGCRLLAHSELAEVDFVETLEPERGAGLGRAVVLHAVALALASGHEGVFLLADSADWTHGWYERLGFRDVGFEWEFTRLPEDPRP